jgi:hypothetical protein
MQTKGSVVREHIAAIAEEGVLDQVARRLPTRTLPVLRDLPIATSWLEYYVLDDILTAYAVVCGEDRVKPLARRAAARYAGYARPLIEGTLRLFGTSPAALLSRMDLIARTSSRGAEYLYTPTSVDSGTLDVRSVGREPPSRAMILAMEAGLELIMEMCGKGHGRVESVELLDRGGAVVARYRVRW